MKVVLIFSIIVIVFVIGIFYMLLSMSPNYVVQTVTVIANTADGCIAETQDGFSVNIGSCDAEPNDVISAEYDSNIIDRIKAVQP